MKGEEEKNRRNESIPDGVTLLAGSFCMDRQPMEPFSEPVMDFLGGLSEKIRGLSRQEAGEELKALGFWLRRQHLLELKERYGRPHVLGLGLSFHIAPSNVPLLFAYTGAIGLLAGNSCRIRVSERRTGESERLCRLIGALLGEERHEAMRGRLGILSYDRNRTDLTEQFSRDCDARVIWGGDRTVEEIRRIPLAPAAAELVFPDRASLCVLGAEAVMVLSDEELKGLAARFYNDTYGMDQNACSCPRLICWAEKSPETGRLASGRFWNAVAEEAERYGLSEIKVSRKYGTLWELAGTDPRIVRLRRWKNRLYVMETAAAGTDVSAAALQFGSFLEYHMKNRAEWADAVTEKIQTLTYFGIGKDELLDTTLRRRLRGVTRIVPVGQALFMEPLWDGKDMICSLSRTIG